MYTLGPTLCLRPLTFGNKVMFTLRDSYNCQHPVAASPHREPKGQVNLASSHLVNVHLHCTSYLPIRR